MHSCHIAAAEAPEHMRVSGRIRRSMGRGCTRGYPMMVGLRGEHSQGGMMVEAVVQAGAPRMTVEESRSCLRRTWEDHMKLLLYSHSWG